MADEDELETIRDRTAALNERIRGMSDRRDQIIRAELADGGSVADLVRRSGLTRARIYQIRDGRR